MGNPAIYEPAITQWVADGRDKMQQLREVEAVAAKLDAKLTETRQAAQMRRLELGALLLKVRGSLPRRGTKHDGWLAYLEAIELDDSTAHRYMELARSPSTSQEISLRSSGPADYDDAPPRTDEDAPSDAEFKANRDAYCTPAPIAEALPRRLGTDPCSNPNSIVVAEVTYMLERGENGLLKPWIRLTYVNGPFSHLLPFAEKLDREKTSPESELTGAGFLVNADNSPAWWHLLTKHLHLRLDFNERQQFIPPPGIEPSKNDRPQTLLMDHAFWAACDQRALLEIGTLWAKQPKA